MSEPTIITDLAEAARLVKKYKKASVWLRSAHDGWQLLKISAASALEGLKDGRFDGFVAKDDAGAIYLNEEDAPAELVATRQLARYRGRVAYWEAAADCESKERMLQHNRSRIADLERLYPSLAVPAAA